MPGMCVMYLLVFLSLNSKTTQMPLPRSKDGKRYKNPTMDMVFLLTDSGHDLHRRCRLERHLYPSTSYGKRIQKAPVLIVQCLPILLSLFLPTTPLSTHFISLFFPYIWFSSPIPLSCSVPWCLLPPPVIFAGIILLSKRVCALFVFSAVLTREPQNPFTEEYSHMCCLPPHTASFQISAKACTCILAGSRAGSIATAHSFQLPTSSEYFQARKPFSYSLCAYAAWSIWLLSISLNAQIESQTLSFLKNAGFGLTSPVR